MPFLVILVLLLFLAIENARSQSMEQVAIRALMLLAEQSGGELIVKDHGRDFVGYADIHYQPDEITREALVNNADLMAMCALILSVETSMEARSLC